MGGIVKDEPKAKGIMGTLGSEPELGSVFGNKMWPARIRLRLMGVLFFAAIALNFGFIALSAASDTDLTRSGGGASLVYSDVVGLLGLAVMGFLLLSSTSKLSTYRKRLRMLGYFSLTFCFLSLLGAYGIREAHGQMIALPLGFAFAFGLVWLMIRAERKGMKLYGVPEDGGDDVVRR